MRLARQTIERNQVANRPAPPLDFSITPLSFGLKATTPCAESGYRPLQMGRVAQNTAQKEPLSSAPGKSPSHLVPSLLVRRRQRKTNPGKFCWPETVRFPQSGFPAAVLPALRKSRSSAPALPSRCFSPHWPSTDLTSDQGLTGSSSWIPPGRTFHICDICLIYGISPQLPPSAFARSFYTHFLATSGWGCHSLTTGQ